MPCNLQFKVALNQPQNANQQSFYQPNSQEMNEESYGSEDECDNESASLSDNGPENMKVTKKLASRQYASNSESQQNLERIIRKRKRKSTDQLKILMREFDKNPNWSKETLLEVSRKTGLSEAQVYKWGWDQKRKKYGPEIAAMMMIPFDQLEFPQEYQSQQQHIPGFPNYPGGLG